MHSFSLTFDIYLESLRSLICIFVYKTNLTCTIVIFPVIIKSVFGNHYHKIMIIYHQICLRNARDLRKARPSKINYQLRPSMVEQ